MRTSGPIYVIVGAWNLCDGRDETLNLHLLSGTAQRLHQDGLNLHTGVPQIPTTVDGTNTA